MSKNIKDTMTHEDCLKFKTEHPNLKRGEVLRHYRVCYRAMKQLGCLDELYPSKTKNYPKEITYEDCVGFRQEHPNLTRRELSCHHGKYYKAMKELGCIDELYPRKKCEDAKNLTYEDCVRFKAENPEMATRFIASHYGGYYRAMRRLGCLYELYPTKQKDKKQDLLTYEDCFKFKKEHPDMGRKELYSHYYSYYMAMRKHGCLEEFYPKKKEKYSDQLTYEDCKKFKEEHPDMKRMELIAHYRGYYNAMTRLGCYDEFYPSRQHEPKFSDEFLIEEAKKYANIREVKENGGKWLLDAIYSRGLKDKAFAHMEALGDRKHRMIYVFEFPDKSAYVGLTYDAEKRHYQHMTYDKSAVKKHIKKTGLVPTMKYLTDYLPVEEARKMEGFYVEQYRKNGWIILNVESTGGIGGTPAKADREAIVELFKQGFIQREIVKRLSVSESTVYSAIRDSGLEYKGRAVNLVEVLDDDGTIIMTFNSAKEAAEYFNIQAQTVRCAIRRHLRCCGHYMRYNAERYEMTKRKKK